MINQQTKIKLFKETLIKSWAIFLRLKTDDFYRSKNFAQLNQGFLNLAIIYLGLGFTANSYSMGLRSFVALPVEKGGNVVRLSVERSTENNTDTLISSYAYGLSGKKTLLLGLPYRLSPSGNNRQGDLSVLSRQTIQQNDSIVGTNRLSLLSGVIVPTNSEQEVAIQAGFVFTHFKKRTEIDADILYQAGLNERNDSGRYDLSWQYRLSPSERPEWGFSKEWNSVLELNGRWNEGSTSSHQLTIGLQRVSQNWVIEGGISQDLNTDKDTRYLLGTRFHF